MSPAKLQLQKAMIALAKTKGENHILVPIFLGNFHFNSYLLFSLLLVSI